MIADKADLEPPKQFPGPAVRRLGWGFADQCLSSLTNVALGVVVAHAVSLRDFGAFSLGLATYLLGLGISRGLVSEPFVVRFSGVTTEERRSKASRATGASLLIGILLGTGSLIAGLLGGSQRGVFIALGLTLPGLILQDGCRYYLVADGRTRLAFVADLIWAATIVPLFLIELSEPAAAAGVLVFMWGVAGTLSALAVLSMERTLPDLSRAYAWMKEQRDLSLRFLGEFILANGALQVTMYLVAVYVGLAAAGSIRAGLLLLGPVAVISQGVRLAYLPEAVRVAGRSTAELRHKVIVLAAVLATAVLAWGGVVLLLPNRLGHAALSNSWAGARALVVPITILVAFSGIQLAAVVGLRALAAARDSLHARILEGALTLAGGTLGALSGKVTYVAWALAIAGGVEVAVWWRQLNKALRREEALREAV